ncbi:hypothetical protein B0H19DRAFT_945541 [Mycena capillaripes]|nr:hypothetical protein B0H19DRAFT_945541 [Mycena capillaripes]
MDQTASKKVLQELVKNHNRLCCDCGNPHPQWASLGFAVFLCLQCAGTHRGFGVHISFVRSISMDTWQPDQLKRMQIGGNTAFKDFMKSYSPAEQGGYKEGNSPYDIYHCWAASQYREKLDAEIAGKAWTQSAPPPPSLSNSTDSVSRSADLPPSQGGRYQGLGSSPAPALASGQHPSYDPSSAAAPSFSNIQENPVAALSKGWSLFSAAVVGATRAVSENVIQPGMDKVRDPNLQASVRGYVSEAGKRAAVVGGAANQWSKDALGVDVAGSVRGRRREAFAGPGQTLKPVKEPLPQSYPNEMEHDPELGLYPASSHASSESAPLTVSPSDAPPSNPPSGPSPASFSTTAEPGVGSSPAARQAHLAAELRAAQALLQRGGKDVDVKATKAKIRELEERQQSAWAQGLE